MSRTAPTSEGNRIRPNIIGYIYTKIMLYLSQLKLEFKLSILIRNAQTYAATSFIWKFAP